MAILGPFSAVSIDMKIKRRVKFNLMRSKIKAGDVFGISVLILYTLLVSSLSFASTEPLRNAKLLMDAQRSRFYNLTQAKVVVANYELLRKDFSHLKHFSNEQWDQWLIKNAGYISTEQQKQTYVNTQIPANLEQYKMGLRPMAYRRAAIFRGDNNEMLDIKGVGTQDAPGPLGKDHSNGLLSVGEGIREFLYEMVVDKIFQHSQSGFETVGNYAVLSAGFEIKNLDGSSSPAGLLVRQAHKRSEYPLQMLSDSASIAVEKIIRLYGLTSAGAHHLKYQFDLMNVQGSSSGAVIDFGGFLSLDHFVRPLTPFALGWKPEAKFSKEYLMIYQPDVRLRLSPELWGQTVTKKPDPAFDNPWIWSHDLARAYANGQADQDAVKKHIDTMTSDFFKKLQLNQLSPYQLSILPMRCHSVFRLRI